MMDLRAAGECETAKRLEDEAPEGVTYLGMAVPPMGWSWAVFLAQAGITSMVEQVLDEDGKQMLPPSQSLIEGAPQLRFEVLLPIHYEYIDDFGVEVIKLCGTQDETQRIAERVKAVLAEHGFCSMPATSEAAFVFR